MLDYPYTIRSDAITAVGAPSTVGFLMRALYWLYLAVRMLYFNPGWYKIQEYSSDIEESIASIPNQPDIEPLRSLFADILSLAKT